MAVVLAFLIGMPLVAVPQVSEHLRGISRTTGGGDAISHQQSVPQPLQTDDANKLDERDATITTLAADRIQLPSIPPNTADVTATIEELKAELVEAGVSYMVLEKIGIDSAKYRFRIDLPVAEGSAYRKRFQVIDDAPDGAMRRALAELQQWQVASRKPAGLNRPTVILR
ncbi:MAG: hypothetical protein H8E66_27165 [Planctomycetes bacterium]|nr:hypothetical protein [Planctomycetota bacterium]